MSDKPDWEHDKLWKRIYMRLAKQRQRGTFKGDTYLEALKIWRLTKEAEPQPHVCEQGQPVVDDRENPDYKTFVYFRNLLQNEDDSVSVTTRSDNPNDPRQGHPRVNIKVKRKTDNTLDSW